MQNVKRLGHLKAFDEFFGDGGDALLGHLREWVSRLGMGIPENDPQAGTIGFLIVGTDSARELCEFER